ncbi:SHOCT domain-containing protein [Rhodoblastus sp.]|uniref:SHOCT domain-containing protein n=1 Tax=Rhodoblastus sp. TaxID=1962975 RepID=UPI0035B1BD50
MKNIFDTARAMAVSAFALAPSLAWAQQPTGTDQYGYGPHMMYWHGGWSGMIFGPLFMILGLALAIAVAVVIVRALFGSSGWMQPPRQASPERTPLDILKERFARGEIEKEEYEQRRRVLGE